MDTLVWVGLGGNRGDVRATLAGARAALAAWSDGPLEASPIYASAPWGDGDQPIFFNQVVGLAPTVAPSALLAALQAMEARFGRDRATERRWGPRTLDLDLLCWPGVRSADPTLILPHPRMAQRRFVLAPLFEVAPGLVPFGLDATVAALLADCPDGGWVRRCW
ncbi:MAG: 2-amino-4-hydroxy-6-hydroxymethyldihydropteridine diphosphokinase [Myxococcales bacterium]|nr:2-amino-4-hydroxy-6-hydroxymethyldihydropteridine diphosphokinase [Myxococcales bacterium]MCB9534778.1 2-amino-4-hydroxy-6-hydroxymethyldihydropteridine diphosphokinase [Myxococcales bacterium]